MKELNIKVVTYIIIGLLLAVGGYYYYGYLQQSSQEIDQATQATVAKTFAGKKLETEVLNDKKFKDLRKVVVEETVLGQPKPTEGGPKLEEIANVPRRHGDPFKPF